MSTELLLAIAVLFVSVGAGTAMVTAWALSDRAPGHERIRRVIDGAGAGTAAEPPRASFSSAIVPHDAVVWVEKILPKSRKELNRLQMRFARAGYRSPAAPAVFSVCEIALPILLAGPALFILGNGPAGWIVGALAAMTGYVAPGFWLDRQIEKRKGRIRDGLPDALDLLVVCLEAGSSMDQAIVKTGSELEIAYPDLAVEIQTIILETRAGKSRVEAFRAFSERTKIEDARALVSMLVQTDRFGTSIAQALRAHAESSRNVRRQIAEERAGKLAVKLVFPLVLFLFPALYVVLLGPAVIEYLRIFTRR